MKQICLNNKYSTTRMLFNNSGPAKKAPSALPDAMEGGLRLKGYHKQSVKNKPLLSIIMVVYNAKNEIEKTILSVINQSYDNIEYIIVDGDSKDGTVELIKKYEDYVDYWRSEKDNGIYDAMNKAVTFTSGDWIYFLNSDDILYNNIEKIISNFSVANGIYYGNTMLKSLNEVHGGPFTPVKLMFKNINHQAIFYPKDVFKKYKYEVKYKSWADYYLNIKCFRDKDFTFIYLPITVALFNDIEGYSKFNVDTVFKKEKNKIFRENFSLNIYIIYLTRKALIDFVELFGLRKTMIKILEKLGLRKYIAYK